MNTNDFAGLARIKSMSLPESEARVAAVVLKSAKAAAAMTIAQVAQHALVSQPTVARFCQSAGFGGWRDFRLWLAASAGAGQAFTQHDVTAKDSPADVFYKVLDRSASTLAQVRHDFDSQAFEKAVQWLSQARRIEFYGQGNSGITAADGAHKFFRIGCNAMAHSDPHLHIASAAMLNKNDVVVALSNSGTTRELLESLQVARESGAKIIALTVPQTPIAQAAHLLLPIDPSEDPNPYAPMASRLAQLVQIDALAIATTIALGDTIKPHLRRYKAVLAKKHLGQ